MARNRDSIVKQSRREGYALHPKAHKVLAKKTTPPGGAKGFRNKPSQYARQLREKQKAKRLYGLVEKPFANLMREANKSIGRSGEVLLQYLERRADNVVYRAGLAPSRPAARQLVTHGHLLLNGKKVDVPSIRLKQGDVLSVKQSSHKTHYFKHLNDVSPASDSSQPSWIKSNRKKLEIQVTGSPKREDIDPDINEQLIVEFYSR